MGALESIRDKRGGIDQREDGVGMDAWGSIQDDVDSCGS